jgi:CheY-like chemotaxis protein
MSAPRTVMVVDDDADIRLVIRMLLEGKGYVVLEASEGGEALALLGEHRPCVILLDLMMPGIDGLKFRSLQLQDDHLRQIPVVILSGGGGVAKKAEEMGVAGYLSKPPELHHLLGAVARLCP